MLIDGPKGAQGPLIGGTFGVAVAVYVVPFGIATPIRLVMVRSKVKDGDAAHVSVCAVSAKPGHPVVDVAGTAGQLNETVEPVGYGVGMGPGGHPVKMRHIVAAVGNAKNKICRLKLLLSFCGRNLRYSYFSPCTVVLWHPLFNSLRSQLS